MYLLFLYDCYLVKVENSLYKWKLSFEIENNESNKRKAIYNDDQTLSIKVHETLLSV